MRRVMSLTSIVRRSRQIGFPRARRDRHPGCRVLLGAVLLAAAGCAYHPRPVVLEAGPVEWRAMVGTWRGSYSTAAAGRRGLIDFTLAAGDREAFGDVLMITAGTYGRDNAFRDDAVRDGAPGQEHSTVLTIRFIRASDGRLMGVTAPYWDRDRGCEATATFYGAIGDGRMAGTFTSLCADGAHALRGHWSVTRTSATGRVTFTTSAHSALAWDYE
jgi:hypothetical protein